VGLSSLRTYRAAGLQVYPLVSLLHPAQMRESMFLLGYSGEAGFQKISWQRAPMGIGRPRLALSRLRVRTPKRTITPLSVDEVARFWSSFRTSRDLAIVGLMLLQGLRSQEVLDLNQDDLLLPEAQIRVRGKGNKTRFLPLAPEAAQLLDHYLRLERPAKSSTALFVSLKGSARGARMTPAGLRSLFRHHRQTSGVKIAKPCSFPIVPDSWFAIENFYSTSQDASADIGVVQANGSVTTTGPASFVVQSVSVGKR
jgi:integrase